MTAPSASDARARPLAGLRVIDLTRALAGPYATFLLAGLGAEVIKVEDPQEGDLARQNSPYVGRDGIVLRKVHDDDVSISHLTRARGKYGVSLNLKNPASSAVFTDLVRISDIVVENFASGTADRLGVGYRFASDINPRIVYCSLSGFGAGVSEGTKAMDVIIQALSGAMMTSGEAGGAPVRLGIPVADMLAPVFAVIGILSALVQRATSGAGQHVDVSMLGALTSFVAIENWQALAAAGIPSRTGLTVPRLSPFGVFPCLDGHVSIVAAHDKFCAALFRAMGQPELIRDSRFASRDGRVAHAQQLEAIIGDWSKSHTTAFVIETLTAAGVPIALVRTPEDAMNDERVLDRGEIIAVRHPAYEVDPQLHTAGVPITFSESSCGFDERLAVHIGEHNEVVYGELLGYSADKIESLRRLGVI